MDWEIKEKGSEIRLEFSEIHGACMNIVIQTQSRLRAWNK